MTWRETIALYLQRRIERWEELEESQGERARKRVERLERWQDRVMHP